MMEEAIEGPDLTPAEIASMATWARLSQLDGLGLGLSGAHRTGKTTLAQNLAGPMLPFLQTSTRAVAEQLGFDVNNPGSLERRLDFQERLLDVYTAAYEAQEGAFVTDRTPLDTAAYMLAEAPTGEIDPALDNRIEAYVDRCFDVMNRHFALVVVVQPGIKFIPVPGVPAYNRAYQEKLNAIMVGLKSRYHGSFGVLSRDIVNLDQRVELVTRLTNQMFSNYRQMLGTLPMQ